jgi:hypothetical protein
MKISTMVLLFVGLSFKPSTGAGPMSYDSVGQAVAFITENVRRDSTEVLYKACLEPQKRASFDNIVEILKVLDRKKPLPELYAGQAFPADGMTFKLGGHGAPWGHVHIDFIKKNKKWFIKKIWQCK